jgi:membrane protein DedA with SNARE-associated domain
MRDGARGGDHQTVLPSQASSELSGLAGWVLDVIDAMGAVGVAALVALENLFPPLPSEIVLPLAGFLAGQGRMSLAAVMVAATTGSVAGALVLYWAGTAIGLQRLRRTAERLPLMDADDVDRAQGWFVRHGRTAVLVGRLVPGVRSLISIPAGVARMPILPFVGYTTLGSGLYNAVLIGLGYQLGNRWTSVEQYSDPINYGVYALLAAGVAVAVVRGVRRGRGRSDERGRGGG